MEKYFLIPQRVFVNIPFIFNLIKLIIQLKQEYTKFKKIQM